MEKPPSKSSSGDDLALIGNVTRIWRHLTFQNSFIWQKCEICRRQQRGNFWLYPVRPKMHSSSERMGILQKPSKLLDEGLTLVNSLLWGGCIFLRCLLCVLHLSWYFCCVRWWWLWHFGAAISKTGSHPDDIDHLEILRSWKGVIFIISIWSKGVMDRAGAEWRRLIRLAAAGRVALIHSGLRQTTSLQSLWKN